MHYRQRDYTIKIVQLNIMTYTRELLLSACKIVDIIILFYNRSIKWAIIIYGPVDPVVYFNIFDFRLVSLHSNKKWDDLWKQYGCVYKTINMLK